MLLRDPDAARMLASMREAWDAGLNPEPGVELLPYTNPVNRITGGMADRRAQKRSMWSGARRSGKAIGGPGGTKPLDLATFALDLAAYLSEPRTAAEMAERFGLSLKGMQARRTSARKAGHWPPKGKAEQWLRNSYTAMQLTLVPA